MADESQRWTLAFRDPVLEREFSLDVAHSWRRPLVYLYLAGAVLWVSCPPTNSIVCGTPGNAAAFTWVELALILPVTLAACAFARFASLTLFVRAWQAMIAVTAAAVLGGLVLACLLVPEPARFDPHWGVQGFALMVVVVCMGLGMRFVGAAIVCLPATVALDLVLTSRWGGSVALVMAGFVNSASAVGVAGSFVLERLRRRAFLSQRHADFERARSERLLHNLLPENIAERLKEVGDAYMVAGGVPTPRADHASAVAEMALEMRAIVAARSFAGRPLRMRIGIHSGPVVAGVIGTKRLIYDLWGDTVNTASRMESHGVEDKVHVSEAVRARLGDAFELAERGPVDIKGKGQMRTWFLERRA